jgi:hypothetical protein
MEILENGINLFLNHSPVLSAPDLFVSILYTLYNQLQAPRADAMSCLFLIEPL